LEGFHVGVAEGQLWSANFAWATYP